MTAWPEEELRVESDDLHIAPFREDGNTYGTPTWIWSVAVNGALYVRPYHGLQSRWYKAAMKQKAGRIVAAGISKDVAFEPVIGPIIDLADDTYREKYRTSRYLDPMIAEGPRSTTVKIVPRSRTA